MYEKWIHILGLGITGMAGGSLLGYGYYSMMSPVEYDCAKEYNIKIPQSLRFHPTIVESCIQMHKYLTDRGVHFLRYRDLKKMLSLLTIIFITAEQATMLIQSSNLPSKSKNIFKKQYEKAIVAQMKLEELVEERIYQTQETSNEDGEMLDPILARNWGNIYNAVDEAIINGSMALDQII